MPIVRAAGGTITSWTGERCDEGGYVVACGDPALHAEVLALAGDPGRLTPAAGCGVGSRTPMGAHSGTIFSPLGGPVV